MKTTTWKRTLSFLLACVLTLGLAVQSMPVAYADVVDEGADTGTTPTTEPVQPLIIPEETSEPETTVSDPSDGSQDPTNPPDTRVTIAVTLVNTKLLDQEGNEIPLPLKAEPNSTLNFQVVPMTGCQMESIKIGQEDMTDKAGTVLTVTVTEDLTITATATDPVKPSLTGVTRMEASWVKEATYKITASDNVEVTEVIVTDAQDQQMPVTASGNGTFYATLTENGEYTILAKDAAGNSVTHSFKEDKIEHNAPEISDAVRSTDAWALSAGYTFTVTDTQAGVQSVKLSSAAGEKALNPDANGNYNFTVTANGDYTITATDKAGNTGTKTVTEAKIDTEAPAISDPVRDPDAWTAEATYTFQATDTGAGVASVSVSDGTNSQTLQANGEGNYQFTVSANGTYTVTVADALGNENSKTVTESKIDLTEPEIQKISRVTEGWAQKADYSITASDSEAGIASVTVTFGQQQIPVTENGEAYTFQAEANGTYTVTVTDNAGHQTTDAATEEKIDTVKPVISEVLRAPKDWATSAEYTFAATDAQAGVEKVELTVGTETVALTPGQDGSYYFTAAKNGDYIITVTDAAGNQITKTVTEGKIDTTGPEISGIARDTLVWAASAEYTFTVTDSQAGVDTVTVTYDGTTTTLTGTNGSYTFTAYDKGEYTIVAKDILGNESKQTITETLIDLTAPQIASVTRDPAVWVQSAEYTIVASDDEAGIASVTVTFGGEDVTVTEANGQYKFTVEANGDYIITVTDKAGHKTENTVTESLIDRIQPELKDLARDPASWTPEASYTFTAVDANAGVKEVTVTFGTETKPLTGTNDTYQFTAQANGKYTVTITDHAGNVYTQDITEDHIDRETPTIQDIETQTSWDAYQNTVTIEASDNVGIRKVEILKGEEVVKEAILENGVYTAVLTSNDNYIALVTDLAGNTWQMPFQINRIDTASPTKPVLHSTGNEIWVNTAVDLTAEATDTQSGVAAYWYTDGDQAFDKNVWKKMTVSEGAGKLHLTQEQNANYRVVAEDGVGRISAENTIRVSIDLTAPETVQVTYGEQDGFNKVVDGLYVYNDKMHFQVKAEDSASGVAKYRYRIAGDAETPWTEVKASEAGIAPMFDTLADGIYHAEVQVQDIAGNWTDVIVPTTGAKTVSFALEVTPQTDADRKAAPAVAAKTADGQDYTSQWTSQNVDVAISGSDAPSGIAGYEYQLVHEDASLNEDKWLPLPIKDGSAQLGFGDDINATLRVRAVTYADNRSNITTLKLQVQKTAPKPASITFDTPTGDNGWHTQLPKYQIHLPEQAPYGAPVQYRIDYTFNGEVQEPIVYNGQNAPAINKDGRWQIKVTAVDAAGNTAATADSEITLHVDTQVPTQVDVLLNGSSILADGNGEVKWDAVNSLDDIVLSYYTIYLNNSIKIQAAAQGGDSGLAKLYYMVLPENEQFKLDGNWTELTADGITLQPDQKCNLFFKAVDNAGNTTYFGGRSIILDGKAPTGKDGSDLTIQIDETNRSAHGYYSGDVKLTIHAEEPVAEPYTVFSGLKSITYRVLKDGTVTQSGNLYPGTGTATKLDGRDQAWDGNLVIDSHKNNSNHILVEIVAKDMADNVKVTTIPVGRIKIDVDQPTMESAYDTNESVSVYNDVDAFTGKRTLTVVATERNFSANESYIRVVDTDTGKVLPHTWVSMGSVHKAVAIIEADGHYTVTARVRDLAGNETTNMNFVPDTKGGPKFILDNTVPTISVSYDNQAVAQGKYFRDPRTVTFTVTERNFNASQFTARVTFTAEDGKTRTHALTNWDSKGSTHTVSFRCEENGTYSVFASGSDALKQAAKPTVYSGVAASSFVVDKSINAPEFTGVENNGSYSGTVVPTFTVTDKNLNSVEASLIWTGKDGETEDVTEKMLGDITLTDIVNGKKAILDVFPNAKDGIYSLRVSCTDKAGNRADTVISFSVNRNGSVYLYDEALMAINGTYRHEITQDLIITEYNPSGIVTGSERVYITRNGEPVPNPIFTVKTTLTRGGWHETVFTIAAENFLEDGTYTVVVSTEDKAGNIPENTADDALIQFSIDNTAPELTSVVGMEKPICKADSISIRLTAMDNVALANVQVYADEQLIHEEELDGYQAEVTFQLGEGYEQHVRIVVTDKAGNVLDTDSDSFTPGYVFQDLITVSSNFWLRFYANKPVFFGSIVAAVAAAVLVIVLILRKKNKKNKEAAN